MLHSLSRLAELAQDWAYLMRCSGWRSAAPEVLQSLAALPYRHARFVILARSLLEPLPDLQAKIPLEIRGFKPTDLDLIRNIDRPSEVNLCAKRLLHGHVGLLALYAGRPAGHAWASDTMEPSVERVELRLEPGDVICVDAYTAPAFRGKGVQTALAVARLALCRERGYRRMLTYIEVGNRPSLAVWQRKLGCQIVGYVDFVRIGPWRRAGYEGG